ncbi:LLM class flavin-dependent oxidoreductase [Nakamurella endophytica]|uniref:N5,N10-methylene tetrahydromethanopterin reductase n=1 Tax=Nakamurella endophytica TaxID=1748367 RepID=A0A917SR48_9ACTN|nr:LLM class flavin-dependent oxidoreductase [Nakamurella endophytica]GGL91862.1 N5,N10-methylene tetrahydromethanopterin reductase [Nakamurella endophytica]
MTSTAPGGLRRATVLAPETGAGWLERVRAVETLGFHTVLVPDTLWTASPFPALAAAAAASPTVRVRTWVIAAPLRSPTATVREVRALQQLSDGRFELGIGTGRPDARREAERLGVSWGTADERIAQLERVVAEVRAQVHPPPPVVVAAGGPRMLARAADIADRICLALPPTATDADLRAAVTRVRDHPRSRPLTVHLSFQVAAVAGVLPAWTARSLDAAAVRGAAGALDGSPADMAGQLVRWRDEYGIDEIVVPGDLADRMGPVIAELRG